MFTFIGLIKTFKQSVNFIFVLQKSSFDNHVLCEIIKSSSERNELEQRQTTFAQLSQNYTILKSKFEEEKYKNATQMNLLELRGEIIRNMQDNDDYNKMRITSLLKDIEVEKQKSKEVK